MDSTYLKKTSNAFSPLKNIWGGNKCVCNFKSSLRVLDAQPNKFFISCKQSRIENNTTFYGCFYLGPFETGQSVTIANALRRTLLSDLTGIAITSVEIEGAIHEYESLVGVREPVLDILLNLKDIILKKSCKHNIALSWGGRPFLFSPPYKLDKGGKRSTNNKKSVYKCFSRKTPPFFAQTKGTRTPSLKKKGKQKKGGAFIFEVKKSGLFPKRKGRLLKKVGKKLYTLEGKAKAGRWGTCTISSQIGYLRTRGPGVVKAADLKLPSYIKCVDPEQYIATLSEDGYLNMKFYVHEGKNYVMKRLTNNMNLNGAATLFHERKKRLRGGATFPSSGGTPFSYRSGVYNALSLFKTKKPFYCTSSISDKGTNGIIALDTHPNFSLGVADALKKKGEEAIYKAYDSRKNKKSVNGNLLHLDAVFMPVTKVNYIIEANEQANDGWIAANHNLMLSKGEREGIAFPSFFPLNNIRGKEALDSLETLSSSFLSENKQRDNITSSSLKGREHQLKGSSVKTNNNMVFFGRTPTKGKGKGVPPGSPKKGKAFAFPSKKGKVKGREDGTPSIKGGGEAEKDKAKEAITALSKTQIGFRGGLKNKLGVGTYTFEQRKEPYLKTTFKIPSEQQPNKNLKHNIMLEIWTNGSIHPRQALYDSFKKVLSIFSKLQKIKIVGSMLKSDKFYKKLITQKFFVSTPKPLILSGDASSPPPFLLQKKGGLFSKVKGNTHLDTHPPKLLLGTNKLLFGGKEVQRKLRPNNYLEKKKVRGSYCVYKKPLSRLILQVKTRKKVHALYKKLKSQTFLTFSKKTQIPYATKRSSNLFFKRNKSNSFANKNHLREVPLLKEKINQSLLPFMSKTLDLIDVGSLNISLRPYTCLKRANIHTVKDLLNCGKQALVEIKNFGVRSLEEVEQSLNEIGLSLD